MDDRVIPPTLSEALEAQRAKFVATAGPGAVERVEAFLEGLRRQRSGALAPALGAVAPDFSIPDVHGALVALAERRARGPVVLVFYRGAWCPYCNLTLRAYQGLLPRIRAAGAALIAISPQTPDASLDTAQKLALEFDVLSDAGSVTARSYGLAFKLPDELQAFYRQRDILLPHFNGDDDWMLPIPATFVLAPDGRVVLAHVEVDYRHRQDPEAVIAVLEAMPRR